MHSNDTGILSFLHPKRFFLLILVSGTNCSWHIEKILGRLTFTSYLLHGIYWSVTFSFIQPFHFHRVTMGKFKRKDCKINRSAPIKIYFEQYRLRTGCHKTLTKEITIYKFVNKLIYKKKNLIVSRFWNTQKQLNEKKRNNSWEPITIEKWRVWFHAKNFY